MPDSSKYQCWNPKSKRWMLFENGRIKTGKKEKFDGVRVKTGKPDGSGAEPAPGEIETDKRIRFNTENNPFWLT